MQKPSRERIALLFFAALAILSLCGLCAYIVAGHSWNVAASTIDDTVGEMEGYIVVVYPGTAEEEAASAQGAKAGSTDPATAAPSRASRGASGSEGAAGSAGLPDDAASADADPSDGADAPAGGAGASDDAAQTASEGMVLFSSRTEDSRQTVDLDALRADYEAKGASVLFLDVADPARYEEGSIVKRGGKRIGIVSAGEGVTQLDVSRCLQGFERASVDFTVVITPDRWKVSRLAGKDVVICTDDEGIVAMGETKDGTFYVDAPPAGEAGVILISPSNVVSAKEVVEN